MSTGFVTWFDFCTHLPMNGASKTQTVIFHRVFIYEGNFVSNCNYSKTWTPCWTGKKIDHIKILKIKTYFIDGTVQEFE